MGRGEREGERRRGEEEMRRWRMGKGEEDGERGGGKENGEGRGRRKGLKEDGERGGGKDVHQTFKTSCISQLRQIDIRKGKMHFRRHLSAL